MAAVTTPALAPAVHSAAEQPLISRSMVEISKEDAGGGAKGGESGGGGCSGGGEGGGRGGGSEGGGSNGGGSEGGGGEGGGGEGGGIKGGGCGGGGGWPAYRRTSSLSRRVVSSPGNSASKVPTKKEKVLWPNGVGARRAGWRAKMVMSEALR